MDKLNKQLKFKNEILKILANHNNRGYVVMKFLEMLIQECYRSNYYEELTSDEKEEIQDITKKAIEYFVIAIDE